MTALPLQGAEGRSTPPVRGDLRLRAELQRAAAAVCTAAWPRGLRAVVLTGSVARDEASLESDGASLRVWGDAECLLIMDETAAVPARAKVAAAAAAIEAALAERGIACRVDLQAVPTRYLTRNPPHCFGFELRQAGRVLWGDADVLALMPGYSASEIPRADGWNLLSNRMIEFLEALAAEPEFSLRGPRYSAGLEYATVKLGLDTATSLLIFRGRFVAGYQPRRLVLSRMSEAGGRAWLPFPLGAFKRRTIWYTEWKLAQRGGRAPVTADIVRQVASDALALWHWELGHMAAPAGTPEAAWLTLAARQAWAQRARGWLCALRATRAQAARVRLWAGWLPRALRATPRLWVYAAAAQALEDAAAPAETARNAGSPRPWLPLPPAGEGPRAWAAAIAANYHLLVEKTRA